MNEQINGLHEEKKEWFIKKRMVYMRKRIVKINKSNCLNNEKMV